MAYITSTRAVRGVRSGESLIAKLSAALARYRLYIRTLAELRALSDRELADLGLSRVSIAEVAHEAAYGK